MKTRLTPYERFLLMAIAFCLIIKYLHVPLAGLISIVVLFAISALYFIPAFLTRKEPGTTDLDLFVNKLAGLSSSITTLGILFTLQSYPGNLNMLIVGMLVLIISLIYILIQNKSRHEAKPFHPWFVIRIVVLILFGGGLLIDQFLL